MAQRRTRVMGKHGNGLLWQQGPCVFFRGNAVTQETYSPQALPHHRTKLNRYSSNSPPQRPLFSGKYPTPLARSEWKETEILFDIGRPAHSTDFHTLTSTIPSTRFLHTSRTPTTATSTHVHAPFPTKIQHRGCNHVPPPTTDATFQGQVPLTDAGGAPMD